MLTLIPALWLLLEYLKRMEQLLSEGDSVVFSAFVLQLDSLCVRHEPNTHHSSWKIGAWGLHSYLVLDSFSCELSCLFCASVVRVISGRAGIVPYERSSAI